MNYYYLKDGKSSDKPVDVKTFMELGLSKSTLVWCEGMSGWQPASDVEELRKMFEANTPPPPPPPPHSFPPPPPSSEPKQKEPTNYLVYSILATLLCCVPTGVVSIVYANKANTSWSMGRYEEAEKATKNARLWLFISIGAGVLTYIVCFILGVFSSLL